MAKILPRRNKKLKDLIHCYSNKRLSAFFLFVVSFRPTRSAITLSLNRILIGFCIFTVIVGNYGFLDLVAVIGYFKVSHTLSFSVYTNKYGL